jgi:hypothetical protein
MPGERLFVLTDDLIGDNDHTHVLEVVLPTTKETWSDELKFDREPPVIKKYAMLDTATCFNITGDGQIDLLTAYSRINERKDMEIETYHVPNCNEEDCACKKWVAERVERFQLNARPTIPTAEDL